MQQPVRVLIVDDLQRARKSVKALLSTWPGTAQVWEAGDGQEAVELARALQPDVVLMDVLMPGMDGLEATRRIKAGQPQVKVIAVSMYGEYKDAALAAGADAFVVKGEAPEALLAVLEAILEEP